MATSFFTELRAEHANPVNAALQIRRVDRVNHSARRLVEEMRMSVDEASIISKRVRCDGECRDARARSIPFDEVLIKGISFAAHIR
ncbi:uncharacterized protein BXIN_0435 [Babesia sp. Xinjiang]|uniref:uncharacterized protein n=1 Tax=Babesia sp. Xinjiang TaxID=462227 RepID=UPI000A22B430|nr:uncharacterized protein BXIN_0435 [Babesia sp. Xinjiang]ORM41044.1 hypothetical protein BXIN_0435 [Babesia sp. Xinjiang]